MTGTVLGTKGIYEFLKIDRLHHLLMIRIVSSPCVTVRSSSRLVHAHVRTYSVLEGIPPTAQLTKR